LSFHSCMHWFSKCCLKILSLGKIPENPGKNGAHNVVWLQKMAPDFCRKTQLKTFFGGHTKNKYSCSLWEKIYGQKAHKNFSGKFGEIRAKILRTPKICLLLMRNDLALCGELKLWLIDLGNCSRRHLARRFGQRHMYLVEPRPGAFIFRLLLGTFIRWCPLELCLFSMLLYHVTTTLLHLWCGV